MRRSYAKIAAEYRANDEKEVLTPDHQEICRAMQQICLSFGQPIVALDAGCGTGRFFHCLVQVKKLVGVDLSQEMLNQARAPVRTGNIQVPEIELRCESIYEASFAAESFDFIYAIGLFGHGCVLTARLCRKFHEWLRKGGKLFFDAFDSDGFPWKIGLRQRARAILYLLLPRCAREHLDKRAALPFFAPTRRALRQLVYAGGFVQVQIESHVREMPFGKGRKLQCLAKK